MVGHRDPWDAAKGEAGQCWCQTCVDVVGCLLRFRLHVSIAVQQHSVLDPELAHQPVVMLSQSLSLPWVASAHFSACNRCMSTLHLLGW